MSFEKLHIADSISLYFWLELLHQSNYAAMQQRTPVRHVWVTGDVPQNAGLSSEITVVSAAPSGIGPGCITTHGWRRGLHSCAASRLTRRWRLGTHQRLSTHSQLATRCQMAKRCQRPNAIEYRSGNLANGCNGWASNQR